MKLIAFILAAYISALAVQPALAEIATMLSEQNENCCGDSCCKNNKGDSKPAKQDPCTMCNPFQACGYCCGCYISEPIKATLISPPSNLIQRTVNETFISDYSSDCFHPPEIV